MTTCTCGAPASYQRVLSAEKREPCCPECVFRRPYEGEPAELRARLRPGYVVRVKGRVVTVEYKP